MFRLLTTDPNYVIRRNGNKQTKYFEQNLHSINSDTSASSNISADAVVETESNGLVPKKQYTQSMGNRKLQKIKTKKGSPFKSVLCSKSLQDDTVEYVEEKRKQQSYTWNKFE
ncbi:hypothetical protein JTB14_031590 [Gonioctena quinquepunctata]|nr:hypothetical protein JTB14_031590 [Gonioctena quinquepunctata]